MQHTTIFHKSVVIPAAPREIIHLTEYSPYVLEIIEKALCTMPEYGTDRLREGITVEADYRISPACYFARGKPINFYVVDRFVYHELIYNSGGSINPDMLVKCGIIPRYPG